MAQDYKYTDEFQTQIAKLREAGKPISAMCKALHIKRSVYYYKGKSKQANTKLSSAIIHEFYLSRSNYGARKLKIQL